MTTRTRRGRRSDEGGFALVMVLGTMFVLTLVVAAALTAAAQGVPFSRSAQDKAAAQAAAQAGVADLVTRLNSCSEYWIRPEMCPPMDLPEPVDGWRTMPHGDPAQSARYKWRYLVTPEPLPTGGTTVTPGLIRVEVTGEVRGTTPKPVRRVVTADLRQPGFLRYIYYSDFESLDPGILAERYPSRTYSTFTLLQGPDADGNYYYVDYSPATFSGVSATTQRCNRYWYSSSGARQSPVERFDGYRGSVLTTVDPWPRSCDIYFGKADVVSGPLHTNDAIQLENGATFDNAVTESSWLARSDDNITPDPDAWGLWRVVRSGDQPAGTKPYYAPPLPLPAQAQDTVNAAGRGCVYSGPTRIEPTSDGRLTVYSPGSTSLSVACGGTAVTTAPTPVDGPVNGVVHVQADSSGKACTVNANGKVLGAYPMSDTVDGTTKTDVTKYSCVAGDAFVSGTVGRPLTISTQGDVVLTGSLRVAGGTSGSNVAGLVAQGNVEVYHPVTCAVTPQSGTVCGDAQWRNMVDPATSKPHAQDIVIEAAIISMAHSFTVQNYDKGTGPNGEQTALGTLTVTGGIYQRFRGPVAEVIDPNTQADQASPKPKVTTGYSAKKYTHDKRLLNLPPPAFPVPGGAQWTVNRFSEQSLW
ncbi:MAG: hypothetical protein M3P48_02030 [Actinomycetota bacterium]|nr:hypothetical protein [Actinomycetota bacterium]